MQLNDFESMQMHILFFHIFDVQMLIIPFVYYFSSIFFLNTNNKCTSVLEIGMLTDSTTCLTTVSYHSIWGTHRCRLHSRSFRHTEIPGVHRFRRHTYADPEGSHEWWCLHLEIVSYNITLLKS